MEKHHVTAKPPREKVHPAPEKKHPEKKKKHHREGIGAELVGDFSGLIGKQFGEGKKKEEVMAEIANEGPEHKQVYAALLLRQMNELLTVIEKMSGKSFSDREELTDREKDRLSGSVSFPDLPASSGKNKKEIGQILSHAPEHEQLLFGSLLQAMNWSAQTLDAVKQ